MTCMLAMTKTRTYYPELFQQAALQYKCALWHLVVIPVTHLKILLQLKHSFSLPLLSTVSLDNRKEDFSEALSQKACFHFPQNNNSLSLPAARQRIAPAP